MEKKAQSPQIILESYFGYSQFREGQKEIIDVILEQRDCLAILPTGGGKSICFQVPGLIFSGITLVISPLISLMKDQVDTLNSKGILSCYISSLLTKEQVTETYQLLKLQKFKFVYIAPERLNSKRFQNCIADMQISLLVVDEAHCISQWGDTFRPSYRKIMPLAKKYIQNCPVVAFTATANQQVQTDICQTLELKKPFIYYKSFQRTNISIQVIHSYSATIKNIVLLRLLKRHNNQAGIIYCSTKKATEQLTLYLQKFGFSCAYYHGDLENIQKQTVQLAFSNGHTKIIVATNAFGMGIDVSNIRFVIHYQIPGNIENYYQEIGRAGRDQKDAWCYTFYCPMDTKIQYELLKKFPKKIVEFEKIKKLLLLNRCRTQQILLHFGEKTKQCQRCDICHKTKGQPQLHIHITKNELEIVKKLIEKRNSNQKINRQFPITDTIIAFLAIVKPQTHTDFLKIPGIGIGFLKKWYTQMQEILALQ